jgi:hypothetical protein
LLKKPSFVLWIIVEKVSAGFIRQENRFSMNQEIKERSRRTNNHTMTLEDRARQFIFYKQIWQKAGGEPNRKRLKAAYQLFEAELVRDLPKDYKIDGLVLVKGYLRTKEKDYPYIAIYTDESFARTRA